MFDREQLAGIARFHRASVEDADAGAGKVAERTVQGAADRGVHLGDIGGRGGFARTDRPDRLGSDDQLGGAARRWQRGDELAGDDVDMVARIAVGFALADADDRITTGLKRRLGLAPDLLVGLMLMLSPLGMA